MEGLTLEEVIEYQRTHPPVKHVYGKWGNLKKQYLIDTGKDWLIEDIRPIFTAQIKPPNKFGKL